VKYNDIIFIIRLEAGLQPNIGNTVWPVLMVFTRPETQM